MSSFDDWFDNKRPPIYTVHTDRLSQDRCIAEQSYNAGMERSAEIAARTGRHSDHSGSPASATPYYDAAIAIRKEIKK